MPISRKQTKGRCEKCGVVKVKRSMSEHVKECYSNETGKEFFHLFIQNPYQKQYWMHVLLRTDVMLKALDELLRDLWLECCGHLSQFLSGEYAYVSYCDELEPGDERMDKTRADKILREGVELGYEYDFGSTTELTIKVLGKMKADISDEALVLARNEEPEATCELCGGKAEFIDSASSYKTYCKKCTTGLGRDEEYLLPLVNSPRTGVCGYTGDVY